MSLSNDLVSQLVKAANNNRKNNSEHTVYGTTVEYDGEIYVRFDGSDLLTPVNTTAKTESGERVIVSVKNHVATVTGSTTSPSARASDVEEAVGYIEAERGRIDDLETINLNVTNVLTAAVADIETLKTDKLNASYATIIEANVNNLTAVNAVIDNLDSTYANINFVDITKAAIENFFSKSGIINDLVVSDESVTGTLVGVTIKGDQIEAGTIVADKLVVMGDDGLYYKLNFEAGTFGEAEEVPRDSLHGSIITAKSITATQVNVDDLIAFDATIGGFNIGVDSLYSGVKESIDNSTRGIYMGTDGQVYFGDSNNYIKYFKDTDEDGNEVWRLAISADSLLFGADSKSSAADLKTLTEHVRIGVYVDSETGDTRPSVELAEGDSDFKQVITNTETMFMDGGTVRTRIDADGIETENLNVEGELRNGNWVWSQRANGNYGLVWKEVSA